MGSPQSCLDNRLVLALLSAISLVDGCSLNRIPKTLTGGTALISGRPQMHPIQRRIFHNSAAEEEAL